MGGGGGALFFSTVLTPSVCDMGLFVMLNPLNLALIITCYFGVCINHCSYLFLKYSYRCGLCFLAMMSGATSALYNMPPYHIMEVVRSFNRTLVRVSLVPVTC